jgi:hypothetical protein
MDAITEIEAVKKRLGPNTVTDKNQMEELAL